MFFLNWQTVSPELLSSREVVHAENGVADIMRIILIKPNTSNGERMPVFGQRNDCTKDTYGL